MNIPQDVSEYQEVRITDQVPALLQIVGDPATDSGTSRSRAPRPANWASAGAPRCAKPRGRLHEYAELFRVLGVDEERERDGVARVVSALRGWRPGLLEQFEGIAEGAGVELSQVVALNARTEIIALGEKPSSECSTLTAEIGDHRYGVQTWDWHVELDPFWHTHTVSGPGLRYAGLTEQGILSKIGVNEAGLALHFNILGHREDRPDGVPMHVLSSVVLSECRSVDEAIELIREAPIASSSAFTMLDAQRAVSVEMSPAGVFVIEAVAGSVQRTNHFQHETPLAAQKSEIYEPDSSERPCSVRARLAEGLPVAPGDLVRVLLTEEASRRSPAAPTCPRATGTGGPPSRRSSPTRRPARSGSSTACPPRPRRGSGAR
uniref:Acyl-coenzyme A/6-aminopenicillanic acid acyl-transferase n=1 Tax=Agromyces sp. (strain KY5R) TaxID=388924 RepID=Q14T93_AGRS5|nr:Acyl-coenzyme A/6-aminopenicillanic acid acyl-transferase [Agromyces sp. KY5R]